MFFVLRVFELSRGKPFSTRVVQQSEGGRGCHTIVTYVGVSVVDVVDVKTSTPSEFVSEPYLRT